MPNYLGINLAKAMKHYKALLREIKESLNERRDRSQSSLFADSTLGNSPTRRNVSITPVSIMAVLLQLFTDMHRTAENCE